MTDEVLYFIDQQHVNVPFRACADVSHHFPAHQQQGQTPEADTSGSLLKMKPVRTRAGKAQTAKRHLMLKLGPAAETMKKPEPRHHTDPVRDETKTLDDSGTKEQCVISCVRQEQSPTVFTQNVSEKRGFTQPLNREDHAFIHAIASGIYAGTVIRAFLKQPKIVPGFTGGHVLLDAKPTAEAGENPFALFSIIAVHTNLKDGARSIFIPYTFLLGLVMSAKRKTQFR
ncbi:hypothetical protein [Pantoea ananatis]|uniref:hypothetical protein n=1 Tax=Pantoea ananas TaxID=553 RepID=UPI001F4E7619|nr:hypothetical protein [Pantoea ananatis]MCH9271743.1 hypothetical protein [Pantoea ananatis]